MSKIRSGVPIITGTHVLERHGDMLLRELEQLVDIGLLFSEYSVNALLADRGADDPLEL